MKIKLFPLLAIFLGHGAMAQQVDFSVVYVGEETALNLTLITSDNDYVCQPIVNRTSTGLEWLTNRILGISTDGNTLAYLSARNDNSNIFLKELGKQGGSIQRTNRSAVLDFTYSPDGKNIIFSEAIGENNQIFQTDASKGYICRQITSGSKDYSPVYASDMSQVYFARQELNGLSIWSHDVKSNYLSTIATGMNPCPVPNSKKLLVCRFNENSHGEIWRIDVENGTEECLVSDAKRSFTTPQISPDGEWILMVGSTPLSMGAGTNQYFYNTDIYVCRTDGTDLTQLTYHAADDLSPVWSNDGKYIYFISQRGSATGTANVWRMSFNL